MFTLKSKEQITQAMERAKARCPRVSFKFFGRYVMTGPRVTTR